MKLILILMIFLLLIVLAILARFGAFAKVEISEKDFGPYWLVFEKHIGSYKNVAPIMDNVYENLKKEGIETTKGFGLYYDKPGDISEENLRSIVGCIVEDDSITEDLKDKFSVVKFPVSPSVIAKFPYKGMVSIIFGVFKVYPKLGTYLEKNECQSSPIMELYDKPNKEILYVSSKTIAKEVFDSYLEYGQ